MSSTLTRRAILAGAGTAVASAALALPCANVALADNVWSVPVEGIADRLERLTGELADALGDYLGGKFAAIVTPEGDVQFARADTLAGNVDQVEQVIAAHQQAWLAFDASCDAADRLSERYGGPEAEILNNQLDDAETVALTALMRAPAQGRHASNRKATYLLTTMGGGGRWEPDQDNIAALLSSLL